MYAYPNSGISLQAGSNGVTVYDGSFQKAGYVTGNINSFDTIDGVDDMLIESVPGRGSRLVDLDGEEISDFYYWIGSVSEYGFHAGKEYGGPSGYVGMDGTELVPFSYDAVYFVEPGYLLAKKENNYNVYSLAGKKLNTEPVGGDLNECRFYTENGFFAPDTGKTVELTRKQYLGYGLIEDTQDAYTSTIYCARTGEIVFEDVEACICIGENIYIWDGENEVYNRYILSWA